MLLLCQGSRAILGALSHGASAMGVCGILKFSVPPSRQWVAFSLLPTFPPDYGPSI